MKKALILSLILGSSIVLLPSFETYAASSPAFKADPQIVIQTRRQSRRNYRSYNRWRDRRNDRRDERSYWRNQNRYYNRGRGDYDRGRVMNRTRISRSGYTTVYRTRTRVRRNY